MPRFFRNMPIGRRVSLIVITTSIIILLVVVYLAVFSTTSALRDFMTRTLTNSNEHLAQQIDNEMDHVAVTLDTIVNEIEPENVDDLQVVEDAIDRIMSQETNLLLSQVAYQTADGTTLIFEFFNSASGRDSLVKVTQRVERPAIFDEELEEGIGVSGQWIGAYESPLVNMPRSVIAYATPVADNLLWAEVLESNVDQLLRAAIVDDPFFASVDGVFTLITDENDEEIALYGNVDDNFDRNLIQEVALEPYNVVIEFPLEQWAAIYTPMAMTGWQYTTFLPLDAIPGLPAEAIIQIAIVAFMGILFMIWLINMMLRQTLVKPISNLSSIAAEIGSGDMRHHIDYQDNKNEIGLLARSLDDMRENLRYSYDTLERRIERRTAELEIARAKAQSTATELQAVYDASLEVVSDFQLQAILDTFTQRITDLLRSDYCGIWLTRSNGEEIRLVSHNADWNVEEYPILGVGEGMVGFTINNAKPTRIDRYSTWEHRVENRLTALMERVLCAPLLSSGGAIGAVVVSRPEGSESFTESDEHLMTLFANLVSPSVSTAQLVMQIQEARHEADRANQVKTRFLASVTHELRTPLNLIINNMDFMRVGAFGDVNEEQESRLNQTIRSAEHLLYLINDLLDVSKIDAGEMQLFIQPMDIYTVVEDALDAAIVVMEGLNKSGHLAINAEIAEDLPIIQADARRIRQVLTNLLSNAVKFTDDGSVTLRVEQDEAFVHFSVIDTGMGIPDEERGKLFAAFERTNSAKQRGIEGTGLGLPISQHLVAMHSGELTFESVEGQGTTFEFKLPIIQDHNTEKITTQSMMLKKASDFNDA